MTTVVTVTVTRKRDFCDANQDGQTDGSDVAAALQTIIERGKEPLHESVEDAFPGSRAGIEVRDGVLQADWIPWSGHYLVSGIQYTDEYVNQERRVESFVNGIPMAPENIHDEASIETVALFAQDDWQIGEHTTLDAGARQYHVEGALEQSSRPGLQVDSRHDSELIASLGITHAISEDVVLRASAAQGYVYPSLLQFAIGAYAGSRYVNPNPELEPETSDSINVGSPHAY